MVGVCGVSLPYPCTYQQVHQGWSTVKAFANSKYIQCMIGTEFENTVLSMYNIFFSQSKKVHTIHSVHTHTYTSHTHTHTHRTISVHDEAKNQCRQIFV